MSRAISAQGTTLKITASGSTAYEIGGLKSYKGFDGSAAEINTTDLSSSSKEFMKGLQDHGKLTLEMNRILDDSGQSELVNAQRSPYPCPFTLTLPNGYTVTFSALVMSFGMSGGVDNVITGSATLRITGDVTISKQTTEKQ